MRPVPALKLDQRSHQRLDQRMAFCPRCNVPMLHARPERDFPDEDVCECLGCGLRQVVSYRHAS